MIQTDMISLDGGLESMAKRRSEGDVGPEWQFKKKRNTIISIVMTEDQSEAIKKVARENKMTASTWLLEVALAALPKSEVKKEW